MTKRGMPRPIAILVAALLALYFVPLGASPAAAAGDADIHVYDQCFTGDPPVGGGECEGWTNGILNDSNSDYNEDEVTPQRLVVTFDEAGTHTIEISYLTFDHNVHAYDSLATWNHTLTNADRCQDIIAADCVGGTASLLAIPPDPTVHHDVGVGVSPIVSNHQLPGQHLELYGGTLTGATYLGMGTHAPDYQTLSVSLTTAAPNTKVMLLFGGHIAATFGPRGWGERANGDNLGAAQVPGGSYHIRITEINDESIGQRDNQLMSGAIEPPAVTDIATNATPGPVVIGGSITDTATVSPSNAVGTVDFEVFGPNDANCTGAVVFSSLDRPVVAGVATSEAFTPTAVGTYRWIASFTPTDPTEFDAVAGSCNDANESSVIVKRQPTIATDAEDEARLLSSNPSLTDVATVSNLTADATGTVNFKVYGPDDTNCTGAVQFDNTKPLGTVTAGVATVTSDPFTPTATGTYRWIASYSGDAKNEPVSGACNDPNESSVVLPALPTIVTHADATATLPGDNTISDSATLSGVTPTAGGTITFKLFGPDPTPGTPTCSEGEGGNLVFTSAAVTVSGPGTYGPVSTTVSQAGTYFWIASYSGDANNSAVSGVCGEANETSVVDRASPQIATSAVGGQLPQVTSISDTATLTGLTADAGGNVTFNVWGPFALDSSPTCEGEPFATQVVAVSGVGADNTIQVPSGAVPITQAGRYYWVASYSGDANNNPVTGSCGDEGETSTVNPAVPTISTTATPGSLPAGSISDSATLTGVTADAGGTITFRLFGPSPSPSCSGAAIFTSAPIAVDGPGTYGPVTTTVANAGSYYWIASYSGDANNSAVAGSCGDAGETSVVTRTNPSISTTATSGTLPPGTISDTATLTGVTASAGGTITFRLFGPSASPNCSGSAVFTTAVAVSGPGSYGPVTATVTAGGSYYWIASYSGDANNNPVSGQCGDAGETSVVRVLEGALNIAKAVSPVAGGGVVIEFGDRLTYTLTVSATGERTQNNVVVTDFVPGFDPARPRSGSTTYVAGSARCVGAVVVPCTVTQPGANGLITWALGDMAAGTTRQVSFQVTIDDVDGDPGETVAVDILNAGAVQSVQTPKKPSNEVVTPVSKVLPVRIPRVLPRSGTDLPIGTMVGSGLALLAMGLVMTAAGRRRRMGAHRG